MSALPRMTLLAPTGLTYDKRKQGWELLEEGPLVKGTPTLDFLGFLREGEIYVDGETVLACATEMDGSESGQHHLERMLQQADRIPVELQKFYLVGTGTKWRHPGGSACAPCLLFRGDGWVLGFRYVGGGRWDGSGRVVRVCK